MPTVSEQERHQKAMPSSFLDVVVISLQSAHKRRQFITSMMENTSLSWRFLDAHRSLENTALQYDAASAVRTSGAVFSQTHLGNYSSHFTAIQSFLEGTAEYLLVLEDDVLLDVSFPFEDFAAHCGKLGMDYVRLFGRYAAPARKIGFYKDRNMVRYQTSPLGCQAYLLTRRGAERMAQELRQVRDFIDIALDRFWETQLPLYGIFPYPVIERYTPTQIPVASIGSGISLKDKCCWYALKMVEKARKILGDYGLLTADRRIRSNSGLFSQIH